MMGNELSKNSTNFSDNNSMTRSINSNSSGSQRSSHTMFPNRVSTEDDTLPWSLLHQCSMAEWKAGHAEAANFTEKIISCDLTLKRDCEPSFCMSKQNITNIEKGNSIFNLHRKMKFSKLAEHFEYNHIPAQLSSVNNFRVKKLLCAKDSLIVLLLSQNGKCQFGLLNLTVNKFKVFGSMFVDEADEGVSVALSPDNSKCLIHLSNLRSSIAGTLSPSKLVPHPSDLPHPPQRDRRRVRNFTSNSNYSDANTNNTNNNVPYAEEDDPHFFANLNTNPHSNSSVHSSLPPSQLLLFDLTSMTLLSRILIQNPLCHFSFDPRYSWNRIAITNCSEAFVDNTLSIVTLKPPSVHKPPKAPSKHKQHAKGGDACKGDAFLWTVKRINHRFKDSKQHYPYPALAQAARAQKLLVDVQHSKDGRLLVATFLNHGCTCDQRHNFRQVIQPFSSPSSPSHMQPNDCSLHVFSSDSAQILHCVCFGRYACAYHTCLSNYLPLFSACGSRIAVRIDLPPSISNWQFPKSTLVQVHSLPSNHLCLQALCRTVILQHYRHHVFLLKLPLKIVNYLNFSPEFNH